MCFETRPSSMLQPTDQHTVNRAMHVWSQTSSKLEPAVYGADAAAEVLEPDPTEVCTPEEGCKRPLVWEAPDALHQVLIACLVVGYHPAHGMQLFMWQRNIVGVAHYSMDCFKVLGALDDAPDDASTSSSSALAAR